MNFETIVVGPLEVNCYIIYDEAKNAVVIDPGDDGEIILAKARELSLSINKVINTHGHFDHIGANEVLKRQLKVPLALHPLDMPLLQEQGRVQGREPLALLRQEAEQRRGP